MTFPQPSGLPPRRLNIGRLVNDLGGARRVAEILGVPRTAPYRWASTGYIASTHLEVLASAHPDLDLMQYFELPN